MPAGQVSRASYAPGQDLIRALPADEGDYNLKLIDIGKRGLVGWQKAGPEKFPYRFLRFAIEGTEDEQTGEEQTMRHVFSTSPKAPPRVGPINFAVVAKYPEAFDFEWPTGPKDSKRLKEMCTQLDQLLEYIMDNEVVLPAHLTVGQFRGEDVNELGYFVGEASGATEEVDDSPAEDSVFGDENTEEPSEEAAEENGSEEPADEEPPRRAAPAKPAAKPNGVNHKRPTPKPAKKPAKK